MSRAARCLAAGLLAALALPALTRAQSRLTGGDLVGRVTDESKAVLPGATVTVTNRDTNVTRTTTTDGQGEFKVPALPPGTYKVAAAVQGFANQTREVTLQLGQTVDLEIALKIAGTQEELTIVSEAPVIDVTDTSVSSHGRAIYIAPTPGERLLWTIERGARGGACTTSSLLPWHW